MDVTAQALRTGGMLRIVDLLSDSEEVDAILLVTSLTIKHFFFDRDALRRLAASARKPFFFYSFSIPTELAVTALTEAGVAVTTNLTGACSALLKMAGPAPSGYGERSAPPPLPGPVKKVLAGSDSLLCEYEVKQILQHYGVVASREELATSESEAVEAAERLGYPLVMKVQSPELPHKTEIGGVRLDIRSGDQAREAWYDLVAAARGHSGGGDLRGILVQGMAPRGHEIIIGTVRDPAMGPIVMVGFGGIAVELYQDVVYRLAPVTEEGARDMLAGLKSAALLAGFRGRPAVDVGPIARLVATVSRLAWELAAEVDEVELNPVIVHADNSGLTVADALMRRRQGKNVTGLAEQNSRPEVVS